MVRVHGQLGAHYESTATVPDPSACVYPPISGCTDSTATNYNPLAQSSDGSCTFAGCTNSNAENYNSLAVTDDGKCEIKGCMDSDNANYNSEATFEDATDCKLVTGCKDPAAENYDSRANHGNDAELCIITGCMDEQAMCTYMRRLRRRMTITGTTLLLRVAT